MTAFLSGEMKDTVELNPYGAYGTFESDQKADVYIVLVLMDREIAPDLCHDV